MNAAQHHVLSNKFRDGGFDRRTFVARAATLGVSAVAAGAGFVSLVSAQEATKPDTTELTPDNIGVEGIEHSSDTSKGIINLYSSWPMTGASELLGGDMAEAIRFAVEIFGGAAGGYAINYEALDDGVAANNGSWDATRESQNATMVVDDEDAMVYIATYNSGAAEVAIPITNEAGLAMISPSNTAIALTKESPGNPEGYPEVLYPSGTRNYMRVCPADDIQGAAAANFAMNDLGAQRAFILHDGQTYGRGVAQVFNDAFERLGGETLGFERYDTSASDYQVLMTSIASLQPDVLYVGAVADLNVPALLQEMRRHMTADEVHFLGPDGLLNQSLIEDAEDASDRAYITFAGLPPTAIDDRGVVWYRAMSDRLGRGPNPYAMYAFDAAVVALQAIDAVGDNDRAKILDQMFRTTDFRGLMGTWSFTETGDTTAGTISLNQVRFGHFIYEQVITPPDQG